MQRPHSPTWPIETASPESPKPLWQDLLAAFMAIVPCTLLAWFTRNWGDLAFHIMIYVATTVAVAFRYGRRASIFAFIMGLLAYNYFFDIPPFTLTVRNWPRLVTFGSMLAITQVVAGLVHRLRIQTSLAQAREEEASTLYALSQAISSERSPEGILREAKAFFEREYELFLEITTDANPQPEAGLLAVPIEGAQRRLGHLLLPSGGHWESLLQACAVPIAQALERAQMSAEIERTRVEAEAERTRSTLLSGVSHDLLTPLSAIGVASTLLSQDGELMAPEERHDLAAIIATESARLEHLVENILEITRLDRSDMAINREWQPLEGVVGSTLTHLESQRGPLPVEVRLPTDLPLVSIDGALLEQLLVNLLENALKYAPGSGVVLSAESRPGEVVVEVRDGGPGVPNALHERIFDRFFRAPGTRGDGGLGLGLAICKAIVRSHQGRIWVEAAAGGGAAFRFTLPTEQAPPAFPEGIPS